MWKITFIVLFNVLSFPRTIYNVFSPNLSGTKHKTSHNKCDNVAVNVNVNVISGDMDLLFTPHCSKYTSLQPTGSVSGRHHSFSFCHIRIRLNSIIFQSLKCHNEPRLEQKMQKPAFLRLGGGAGPWHLETAFSAARAICAKINKYCTTWQQ